MTNETGPSQISNEDLAAIQDAKNNVAYVKVLYEKAQAELMAAELQTQNLILKTYMKYGLSQHDTIDQSGNVLRAATQAVEPQPQESESNDNS